MADKAIKVAVLVAGPIHKETKTTECTYRAQNTCKIHDQQTTNDEFHYKAQFYMCLS